MKFQEVVLICRKQTRDLVVRRACVRVRDDDERSHCRPLRPCQHHFVAAVLRRLFVAVGKNTMTMTLFDDDCFSSLECIHSPPL